MNIIRFPSPSRRRSRGDAALAAELRVLAKDVERGEVRQIVLTVIRQDGEIRRLGTVPDLSKTV